MSDLKIKAKKIDEKIAENYTKIKIGGTAEIIYGDNVIKCKNKFTRYLMSTVVVFVCNGNVYVGSADGNLYCLNISSGNTKWVFSTDDAITYSSPALYKNK